MKGRRLQIREGLKQDLTGATSIDRTFFTQHGFLHKPHIRATKDQENIFAFAPLAIPQFLQNRWQFWARLDHPLELVQNQDELLPSLFLSNNPLQGFPPSR